MGHDNMNGKSKCAILKEIRKQIAENNNIEYIISECKHQGNCKGTCPKCESEVRYLEKELDKRRKAGKAVAIAGISAACLATMTGCTITDVADFGVNVIENIQQKVNHLKQPDVLIGEIATEEETYYELDGEVPSDYELDGYVENQNIPD